MFLGHFRHAVDPKGRVAVPATFRRDLALSPVISPGLEGRLVIWPEPAWNGYVERFQLASSTESEQRRYMRFLFAKSRAIDFDAQGRLLLSEEHRRFAAITDRAVFVGMSDCVELVGEERWDTEQQSLDADLFTELGDRVNQLGAKFRPLAAT